MYIYMYLISLSPSLPLSPSLSPSLPPSLSSSLPPSLSPSLPLSLIADTIPIDKLNVDLKLGTVKLNRKSGHSSSGCSC